MINKKKYKYGGKKKNLGGLIGTGAGAIGGAFLGNPMLGASIGGKLGAGLDNILSKDNEVPELPITRSAGHMGLANGGFLNYDMSFQNPKLAHGGEIDAGGRQKKGKSNLEQTFDTYLNPVQQAYKKDKKLKGGKEKTIGQDATKFEGNKHEDGGIEVDNNTEVEGGETKDNIGGKDYVFSDRLKVPGTYQTFSEVHEQMVNNNASPNDITKLAQLQEDIAGRS